MVKPAIKNIIEASQFATGTGLLMKTLACSRFQSQNFSLNFDIVIIDGILFIWKQNVSYYRNNQKTLCKCRGDLPGKVSHENVLSLQVKSLPLS